MKARYILDECLNLAEYCYKSKDTVFSQDIFGMGATDDTIIDYAIKKNLIPITKDLGFTFKTALNNHPVIFRLKDGRYIKIKGKEVDMTKFNNSLTFYILDSDKVIIP